VVLTPRRWCQVRGKQNFSRATVARKPGHRGERGVSRKPLRREGRIASAEPVCSCAFFCACLHTRPRVQRAPGFPCALLFLSRVAIDAKLGRIAPRECGRTSSRCMTMELEIHTDVVPDKRLVRPTGYCKVLAAALARMRRYRSHRPHRSCGWFRQAKAAESLIARRMGGANGSRECAPDDKLRDTHQLHLMEMMGFAGSTHPAS
jgi:hypothetical protein